MDMDIQTDEIKKVENELNDEILSTKFESKEITEANDYNNGIDSKELVPNEGVINKVPIVLKPEINKTASTNFENDESQPIIQIGSDSNSNNDVVSYYNIRIKTQDSDDESLNDSYNKSFSQSSDQNTIFSEDESRSCSQLSFEKNIIIKTNLKKNNFFTDNKNGFHNTDGFLNIQDFPCGFPQMKKCKIDEK